LDGTATISPDGDGASHDIDALLHNKVVFLEPLIHADVDTPVGLMPQYQALASATNELMDGEAIKPGNPTAALIWTLILGVLIGSQCVGRDPLQASWRVSLLMLLNFGYSLIAFLAMGIWADPVLPLVAATVAFLLVTQFTFAVERDERERNRALFSRFVAREFVDELLQSTSGKLALGGEKRTVCVLFADVRNFTGFAESHEPEQVIETMNIYLTALTDALDSYGGLLDKYTGDGLMAFFEIKGDIRTELTRSVNASLAMRDAAIAVSERMFAAGKQALQIGIGMHYGEAIVGLVGNEQRQINYTALGHTVVVSARLQTLAEGGEVVVSEPIFAEVRGSFIFSAMEPVHVKGITAEQRPYRVTRRVGEGVS
jgi:adenylate cyclase